jgi:hypothetical protein
LGRGVFAGAPCAAIAIDGGFLGSRRRLGEESGIEVKSTKIEITHIEKRFASGVFPLPDDVEDMATDAFWQINCETVIGTVAVGFDQVRHRLEIRPLQRLGRIIICFRDEGEEVTGIVRGGGEVDHIVGSGLHRRGWPIHPCLIQSCVFLTSSGGELAIGNEVLVIALGDENCDFIPIVKRLGSRNSHCGLGRCALRPFRIFQENLVNAGDGVGGGSVAEGGSDGGQQADGTSEGGEDIFVHR